MPAEGPWTSRHYGNGFYKVSRRDSRIDYVDLQAHEAQSKVAELNAAERVRDAAPQLLAACWEVIRSNALRDMPEIEEMVGNAIAAAEGEQ